MKKMACMLLALGLTAAVFLAGCGAKPEDPASQTEGSAERSPTGSSAPQETHAAADLPADRTRIDEIKAEAKRMSDDELVAEAKKYVHAVDAQAKDFETLSKEFVQMSVEDAAGDKGDEILANVERLGETSDETSDRLQVYMDEIASRGIDMSKIDWEVEK